jgi:SAM-dependent methyltransferase
VREHQMSLEEHVLIVGGSVRDEQILRQAGFRSTVNSNLPSYGQPAVGLALDAEQIDLPSESFDLVFASEVLHHCVSPHKALCEMLRVARRFVIFMEPNDCFFMNTLVKLNFSFPYELPTVAAHTYQSGGLRDSCIPNFVYRWNAHEVEKTVSSCIPERQFSVHARPYWDFSHSREDLAMRPDTRIGQVTRIVGVGNFLRLLRLAMFTSNAVPFLRGQGNKFFCSIQKNWTLKPWMTWERDGKVVFNREYGKGR